MKKAIVFLVCILLCIGGYSAAWAEGEADTLLPAVVNHNNVEKWGYINQDGQFVIKPQFSAAKGFTSKGIAIVVNSMKDDSLYGICSISFIDKAGKVVLGPFTTNVPEFKDGYAVVFEEGKGSKVINEEGKIVLQSKNKIQSVSEGMMSFSQSTSSGTRYGYLDINGKTVFPAKYLSAGDFEDGKAWVEVADKKLHLIDKKGNVLSVSDRYRYDPKIDPGIISYRDEKKGKYGYKASDGKILISPKYEEANEFVDGAAVVCVETEKNDYQYALINKKGEYIFKPEFSGITGIGDGLYTVTKNNYYTLSDYHFPHAILNREGKQLSDYVYYNIQTCKGEYLSACSGTETFFIDKSGKIVDSFPKIKGIGKLGQIGDIIKAEIEGDLAYYRKDGTLIWKKSDMYSVDGIKVRKNQFRPDFYTYVEYPEIQGISDLKIQEKINKKLKELFIGEYEKKESAEEEEYLQTDDVRFSVSKNKDLLIVEKDGYYYPIGAAHGMPTQTFYHIDLKTGVFYNLKDLFKANSKFTDKLTAIVRKQIELNLKIKEEAFAFYYFSDKPAVSQDIGFTVTKDALKVYYAPYEITAYAGGFPAFEIPYGQITELINTNGLFWNAFNKEIKKSKINLLSSMDEKTVPAIESQMKAYESKIIDAVNSNDFKKVEPLLLKDSGLYKAQKKLVQDLYRQGIKEKLIGYEIYAMGYLYDKKEYKVYVTEEVSIKYPQKNYVTKKFSWCYTVKLDEKTMNFKLTNIEKW